MADESLLTPELQAVARSRAVYGGDEGRTLNDGDPVPGYVLMSLSPGSDAGGDDGELRVPDPLPKSLLVSNEFAIERPIRLGEVLQARSRIADISERLGGQFGHGIYVRTDVEFTGADGALAGRTSNTLMYYDPAGRREGGADDAG
jgi:hypothetical protein